MIGQKKKKKKFDLQNEDKFIYIEYLGESVVK